MSEQVLDSTAMANYNFTGAEAAPADTNPDRQAQRDLPPGDLRLVVKDFKVKPNHQFSWDKRYYVLHQFRPILCGPDGLPYAGASIMDFLPLPTPGQEWCAGLAERWINFIRSLGFDVPKGHAVPAGFQLPQVVGRECLATIQYQVQNKVVKTKDDGSPYTQVKMFSYARVPAGWVYTPSGLATPPAPAPAPAPAPRQFAPSPVALQQPVAPAPLAHVLPPAPPEAVTAGMPSSNPPTAFDPPDKDGLVHFPPQEVSAEAQGVQMPPTTPSMEQITPQSSDDVRALLEVQKPSTGFDAVLPGKETAAANYKEFGQVEMPTMEAAPAAAETPAPDAPPEKKRRSRKKKA